MKPANGKAIIVPAWDPVKRKYFYGIIAQRYAEKDIYISMTTLMDLCVAQPTELQSKPFGFLSTKDGTIW